MITRNQIEVLRLLAHMEENLPRDGSRIRIDYSAPVSLDGKSVDVNTLKEIENTQHYLINEFYLWCLYFNKRKDLHSFRFFTTSVLLTEYCEQRGYEPPYKWDTHGKMMMKSDDWKQLRDMFQIRVLEKLTI